MELLDLYDDLGKNLNETIVRGEKIPNNKNIMLSVVYIKNKENKYLIQKTSTAKGNKYSTTGGHVMHGETGLETIIREIKEELNIKIYETDIQHIITFKYPTKNCIFNVYYINKDNIDISNIKVQKEEVDDVYYLSVKEIKQLIEDNKFLESHGYIFNNYIITI